MDPTLLTILLLLVLATVIALVQARKRDKCLQDFEDFHVTLAEKGGDLSWGRADVYPSGLEVRYVEPVVAREGHLERSFIFYKDQYEAMDGLYRYAEGLPAQEQARRRQVIKQTAQPSAMRKLRRRLRNWISMVRDALVQAASLVIGAAKTRAPGSAVLGTQEQQLKSLSNEIIGHAGNAFDPLLEEHLFQQVVLEVTTDGTTRSYCGWLKDYTSQFVEVVDAFANGRGKREPVEAYAPGDARLAGLTLSLEHHQLRIANATEHMLYIDRLTADAWMRPMGTVLPPAYTANLRLPRNVDPEQMRAYIGTADRVDMVVPRTHALVRHAARGPAERPSGSSRKTRQKTTTQQKAQPGPAQISAADLYDREQQKS